MYKVCKKIWVSVFEVQQLHLSQIKYCALSFECDWEQGRIIHCVGCTMGGGPRSAAKFLTRCFDVWTFSVYRLKRNEDNHDDYKNVVNFLEKKCTAR